jgi:hypothetical protein
VLVVENGVARLRSRVGLVLRRRSRRIYNGRTVVAVVVVVALGAGYGVVCAGRVVFQLIMLILLEGGVEIFLKVAPARLIRGKG